MTAKHQIESSLNSVAMLDGTGGHVNRERASRGETQFGIRHLGYGGGWLAGNITAGLLYAHPRTVLIALSLVTRKLGQIRK